MGYFDALSKICKQTGRKLHFDDQFVYIDYSNSFVGIQIDSILEITETEVVWSIKTEKTITTIWKEIEFIHTSIL
jgi:hypothetical protein